MSKKSIYKVSVPQDDTTWPTLRGVGDTFVNAISHEDAKLKWFYSRYPSRTSASFNPLLVWIKDNVRVDYVGELLLTD